MNAHVQMLCLGLICSSCVEREGEPSAQRTSLREATSESGQLAGRLKPSQPAGDSERLGWISSSREVLEGEALPLPSLPEREETPPEVTASTSEGLGEAEITPTPWDLNAFVRPRKRMDVDQLSRAFDQLTGGEGWRTADGRQDGWRVRWATLGGPDFISRVTENLRPNALFHKLIRDAAIEVCVPLIEREVPASGELPSSRHIALIDDPRAPLSDTPLLRAALSDLLLRAHGVALDQGDAELEGWVSMMLTVSAQSADPAEPWRALCIATIIHPRFWSY